MTEILAVPAATMDAGNRDYREKTVHILGTLPNSNVRYRATGEVIAEPRSQRASLLVTALDRLQSASESFQLTPDVVNALQAFKPPTDSPDDGARHIERIAATATKSITKVYGEHRELVLLAVLLAFHSLREIPWNGETALVATFKHWTGWRTQEVLSLMWSQVDVEHGIVRLEPDTTKNDDGRELPFHALPELDAVLRRQRVRADNLEQALGRPIPWVFFWSVPHAKNQAGRPIKNYLDGWHAACRKAGIEGRRVPHDFRRTTVRRYERAGVARSVAMSLTGHKTTSVYTRYAIANAADKAEGLAKVAALGSAHAVLARIEESRKVSAKSGRLNGRTASSGTT